MSSVLSERASEKMRAAERSEQCGAGERVSGANEQTEQQMQSSLRVNFIVD